MLFGHVKTAFQQPMTARGFLLKIHLWLGLAAAIFLVILGLTGSVMAFENDIAHWLHPNLFYVKAGARTLPEQALIRMAERRIAPARVAAVQIFRQPNLARVMRTTDRRSVFVNPYDGSILGSVRGGFSIDRVMANVHQIHLRLVPDLRMAPRAAAAGKVVISFAGLMLCVLVPTGLILFRRTRRATIKWNASWFRICFDAHHVIGVYGSLFLLITAFTGILIGFESGERAIYALTGSRPPAPMTEAQSLPVAGAAPVSADRAIEIAHGAIVNAALAGVLVPLTPKAVGTVLLRVPEETSENANGSVSIDQYSGQVLQVRNLLADSPGYRLIRFNRSIHTGDIRGLPSHIVMSLSSLLLVVMVVTGIVIWLKKLAI
jgi:uncharacterized iron-regulated membrane protein